MGGTGNQLDHLYSCVLHVLYLIVGMITTSFIGAPTSTRALLLILVPVNLATTYHYGDSAALNFPSMTALIFASTAGIWMHLAVMLNITYRTCKRNKHYSETGGFYSGEY